MFKLLSLCSLLNVSKAAELPLEVDLGTDTSVVDPDGGVGPQARDRTHDAFFVRERGSENNEPGGG